MPTGRFGEVEELANLVVYIVSDYANWMNGEVPQLYYVTLVIISFSLKVITFDGGELPRIAGEFNDLLAVTTEQWDQLEAIIKATKGS